MWKDCFVHEKESFIKKSQTFHHEIEYHGNRLSSTRKRELPRHSIAVIKKSEGNVQSTKAIGALIFLCYTLLFPHKVDGNVEQIAAWREFSNNDWASVTSIEIEILFVRCHSCACPMNIFPWSLFILSFHSFTSFWSRFASIRQIFFVLRLIRDHARIDRRNSCRYSWW